VQAMLTGQGLVTDLKKSATEREERESGEGGWRGGGSGWRKGRRAAQTAAGSRASHAEDFWNTYLEHDIGEMRNLASMACDLAACLGVVRAG
jgi:hypothetical protein